MTPQEMMDTFLKTGDYGFLGELDIFELLAFLETSPHALSGSWTDYSHMIHFVGAELRRERKADWDTWNNLLALDKSIDSEWVEEFEAILSGKTWIDVSVIREVLAYLKDRKHDG